MGKDKAENQEDNTIQVQDQIKDIELDMTGIVRAINDGKILVEYVTVTFNKTEFKNIFILIKTAKELYSQGLFDAPPPPQKEPINTSKHITKRKTCDIIELKKAFADVNERQKAIMTGYYIKTETQDKNSNIVTDHDIVKDIELDLFGTVIFIGNAKVLINYHPVIFELNNFTKKFDLAKPAAKPSNTTELFLEEYKATYRYSAKPNSQKTIPPSIQPSSGIKKCPFCAEEIESNAVKCKFCDSSLE